MWRNSTIRAAAALDASACATCICCGATKAAATSAATPLPRFSPRTASEAQERAAAPTKRARRGVRRRPSASPVAVQPASKKGGVVIAASGPGLFYNIVRITNHATLSTWVPQRPAPMVALRTDRGEVHTVVDVEHLAACDYLRTRGKSAKLSSHGGGKLHSCECAHHPAVLARWFAIASEQRIARDAIETARAAHNAKLSVAATAWTPSAPRSNSASLAHSNAPHATNAARAFATQLIPSALSRHSPLRSSLRSPFSLPANSASPSPSPSPSPLRSSPPAAFEEPANALARSTARSTARGRRTRAGRTRSPPTRASRRRA